MAVSKHGPLLCFLMFFSVSSCTNTTTIPPHEYYYTNSQHAESSSRPFCDTDQIEYRLTKLEVQIGEKSAQVNSELRESNRRLQALEIQSAETRSFIDGLRNEIIRLTESNQAIPYHLPYYNQVDNDKLESKVDNLIKGMQLVVVALRGVRSDVSFVKTNISELLNTTSKLLQQYDDLATKQFVSNYLGDVKQNDMYSQIPSNLFREPSRASANGTSYPRSCKEVQEDGETDSGIYLIRPEHAHKPFMVLCDLETKDGGWTYIHNRYDGSQDFFLKWHDYKTGFGNIGGEFWLGLEHIHQLTGHEVHELLVELVDVNGDKAHAHYAAFSIGSEVEGYSLKVLGGYDGNAGDSLRYHAGARFSARDLDQDNWVEGNCALSHTGAWWYKECDASNLNGKYLNGVLPENYIYQGMYWGEFRGPQYSLSQARMMIRPRHRNSPPVFPRGVSGNRSTP